MTKRNGKWSVQINRKGVRLKTQFTSKALASQWANKVEVEIINGTYQDNNELVKMSVGELVDLFFDHTRLNTAHESRLRDECNKLKRYPIASIKLGYLNGKHVASFRDQLLSEGLAKSTVRKYMGLTQRAVDIGRKELGIPMTHNPVMLVTKPREDDARDRILSESEWELLLKECEQSSIRWFKQFVMFARETVCRRSEILRVSRFDVNFDKGTLHLPKTKNGSPRTVGLSPKAIEILKSLPVSVDGKYFSTPHKSQDNLGNAISKTFARCVKKAGIKNFRLHDVRHMSASDYAMQGWSIAELSAQGGWKSLSQLKRYTHIKGEHLAQKMRGQDGR
mgnify:CR=1 FL=1